MKQPIESPGKIVLAYSGGLDTSVILPWLKERYPGVEVAVWLARMAKGRVVDETGLRLHPGSPYRVGACIFYYREVESEKSIPFDEHILYQDEHILVADKPHFLPVVPAGRFLMKHFSSMKGRWG